MNYRLIKFLFQCPKVIDGGFIDTYNMSMSPLAGTIQAGINQRNLHFVMEKTKTEVLNACDGGDVATTITTAHHYSGNIIAPKRGQKEMGVVTQTKETYRIRKLTPRECFRLMGVTDTEIDTIQAAGLPDTRQYQLAGNSIVVDVLAEIFNKMFVDTSILEPKLF